MIAIVNVGPAPGNCSRRRAIDPLGPHLYELRINAQPVARFEHRRGDDLTTCLQHAATAAQQAQERRLVELIHRLEHAAK